MATTSKFAHELEPGDEYAPLELRITHELNQQFLYGQEDFGRRYLPRDGGGEGEGLVHHSLLLQMAANTKSPSFKLAPGTGSILSEASTAFVRDVAVGERIVVTWNVTDAYEKRGRRYYVMRVEMVDEARRTILRRTLHLTFPRSEGAS